MFKIAKSIDTADEEIIFKTVSIKVCHFDKEKNQSIETEVDALEINVRGMVKREEYILHFIISKPISDYESMKKYEGLVITENDIKDSYIVVNGITDVDLKMDLKMIRFDTTVLFSLLFRNDNMDIFGTAEMELDLNKLKSKK